jgi:hypothetical protein
MRSVWGAAAAVVAITISMVLVPFQGSASGQQGTVGPAPAAPGGQRGAPGGGRGRISGPRIPDGALKPGAPHPDPLPVDLFTTKNFYKDRAL